MALHAAIQALLGAAGVTNGMPGWAILESARLLPPTPGSGAAFGDGPAQALRKVMKAYYEYGRNHWTWAQSAGGAAANGGLVKGQIQAVACGSFNQNFKWLAEKGLGITGITNGQETGQFLTMPGSVCIDSKWVGNVRTSTKAFGSLRCFKFSGHYWVMHGGVNYDVCYDNTFHSVSEIIWTRLLQPDQSLVGKGGARSEPDLPPGEAAPGGRPPRDAPAERAERLALVADRPEGADQVAEVGGGPRSGRPVRRARSLARRRGRPRLQRAGAAGSSGASRR